jgi:hypothetical protein
MQDPEQNNQVDCSVCETGLLLGLLLLLLVVVVWAVGLYLLSICARWSAAAACCCHSTDQCWV